MLVINRRVLTSIKKLRADVATSVTPVSYVMVHGIGPFTPQPSYTSCPSCEASLHYNSVFHDELIFPRKYLNFKWHLHEKQSSHSWPQFTVRTPVHDMASLLTQSHSLLKVIVLLRKLYYIYIYIYNKFSFIIVGTYWWWRKPLL